MAWSARFPDRCASGDQRRGPRAASSHADSAGRGLQTAEVCRPAEMEPPGDRLVRCAVAEIRRFDDRPGEHVVAAVTEHRERSPHRLTQVLESLRRGAAQPQRPVGQAVRIAQQPDQPPGIGFAGIGRRDGTRLAVDPIALEPEQTAWPEVDDVAFERHPVREQVELRHVLGVQRLAERSCHRDLGSDRQQSVPRVHHPDAEDPSGAEQRRHLAATAGQIDGLAPQHGAVGPQRLTHVPQPRSEQDVGLGGGRRIARGDRDVVPTDATVAVAGDPDELRMPAEERRRDLPPLVETDRVQDRPDDLDVTRPQFVDAVAAADVGRVAPPHVGVDDEVLQIGRQRELSGERPLVQEVGDPPPQRTLARGVTVRATWPARRLRRACAGRCHPPAVR